MSRVSSFEDLLHVARRLEDQPLETVTGRVFTVGVFRDRELVFTPSATGNGQSEGRRGQERFLARYLETGSLRPRDYADVSRNAAYLIGLLLASERLDGR